MQQPRHQVLEHRRAPRQERGRAVDAGERPAELEPVLLRHVLLGDREEAREPRLGGEQVVASTCRGARAPRRRRAGSRSRTACAARRRGSGSPSPRRTPRRARRALRAALRAAGSVRFPPFAASASSDSMLSARSAVRRAISRSAADAGWPLAEGWRSPAATLREQHALARLGRVARRLAQLGDELRAGARAARPAAAAGPAPCPGPGRAARRCRRAPRQGGGCSGRRASPRSPWASDDQRAGQVAAVDGRHVARAAAARASACRTS